MVDAAAAEVVVIVEALPHQVVMRHPNNKIPITSKANRCSSTATTTTNLDRHKCSNNNIHRSNNIHNINNIHRSNNIHKVMGTSSSL